MESTTSNFSHLQIPLEEVLKATNNFDKKNVIGQGELGKVYKGKLLRSEKWVKIAARRLDSKHKRRIEFLTEISALSSLQHENIVSIIGFCDENDEKVIINEYLAKGSLEMHLSKPSLTWVQRLKICIGVARALSYIHFEDGRGSCVIHRNINSSTILLNNKLEPKLSGFEYSVKQSVHRIDQVFIKETIGTKGYVDPAIEMTGGVTYKSDVYSFGVVLWEVLYGRKAFISDEFDRFLTPLARFHFENKTPNVIPPVLNDQLGMESARILKDAAYSCSNDEREERPSLKTINNVLERALELQLQHQSLYRANLEDLTSQLSHLKIRLADINSAKFYHRAKFYDVYRAELQQWNKKNSATVFIKRLCPREDKTREDVFATDIEMLTTCKHPNIVTLVGFCDEDDEKILVIEDAPNGYLIDYLVKDNDKDMSLLSWEKRLKICLDVAYGLKYLHYEMDDQKTVINGDFTTMSIALDENFVAKIVDFGFSMFLPPNQDSLHVKLVRGSKFYIDPEYAGGGVLTRASDVYTFGVILFEVLCGRMASHEMYLKESEVGLVYVARRCFLDGTLTDIIDPIIKEASDDNNLIITKGPDKDSLDTFVNLAYQCVATVQRARPTMEFIVEELEKALSFQAKARCQQHSDQVVDGVDHLTLANSEHLKYAIERPTPNYMKLKEGFHPLAFQLAPPLQANLFEHLHIPLGDIMLATKNFSDEYCIREFKDCYFYRVELEHFDQEKYFASITEENGNKPPKKRSTVIIKRFHGEDKVTKELLFNEIEMLTTCRHPNVVTLLGFCVEDFDEVILIFENAHEFLASSLYIKDTFVLTWSRRLRICLDVAYGLKYLHNQKMILHCNITSLDIFVDEYFRAKISNFGYSVFLYRNQNDCDFNKRLLSHMNDCYLDPVFCKTGIFTKKTDVYCFGVLLFEIACGMLAFNEIYESDNGIAAAARRCFHNGTLKEMIDPLIKEESRENNFTLFKGPNENSLNAFLKIAAACVETDPRKRPEMKVIVEKLEKTLSYQENHKDPFKISLDDIRSATQNFHHDNCVGGGGFGKVYKGKLPHGDHIVVAKRLDTSSRQGEKQFQSELQILFEYKHENIISLVGYCDEKDEKIIVYEYASKGSLDRYLNHTSLTWMKRLHICIGVATALDFLHSGVGKQATVIHRDIKTENILLTAELNAKLADFGLSLISAINKETDYVIDGACGTPGYVDPLYVQSNFLTKESDIYSFGVVLFEILCGRSTFFIHKQKGVYIPSFIKNSFDKGKIDEVVFEKIKTQIKPEALTEFYTIAYRCLNEKREERPKAKEVVEQLNKALELQMSTGDGASSTTNTSFQVQD